MSEGGHHESQPRGGKPRTGVKPAFSGTGPNNAHRQGKFGSKAPAKDGEKYVVIISNVENDFAKVHQYSLPSYCCLDAQRSLLTAGAGATHCTYDIKCRVETRSAEMVVTGPADASVSDVFAPRRNRNPQQGKQDRAPTTTTDDATTPCEMSESTAGGSHSSPSDVRCFGSLEAMATTLQRKPYFTHPPTFLLNLPEGELRLERKRPREDDDAVDPTSASGDAKAPEKILLNKAPRVFDGHQRELVSAVAAVGAQWSAREARTHLSELPGFLSCWPLYRKHFRVVFEHKDALFRAKKLLDQFAVAGSVRVSLTLSDQLTRSMDEFLAAEDVPADL